MKCWRTPFMKVIWTPIKRAIGKATPQGLKAAIKKVCFAGFAEGIKHARRKVGELFTKAGEHIHNWADNIKTGTEHMYENAKRFWSGKSKSLAKDIGDVEGELSDDMDAIAHNISPF